tara:strand:+ start:336 stop:1352 length:1017 start_codon:yes stop_codon:yes gene_type:complete
MVKNISLSAEDAFERAIKCFKEGKLNESFTIFQSIRKLEPQNFIANYHIGLILSRIGRYNDSIDYFEKCIKSDPSNIEVLQILVQACMRSGKIQEARKIFHTYKGNHQNSEDQLMALQYQIYPKEKLDFFYNYLKDLGVFECKEDQIIQINSKPKPLLTNSFLNWFETQSWSNYKLLELGSGSSTLYFSTFFKSVTSYETNEYWYNKIVKNIDKSVSLNKCNSILDSLDHENINEYDVVLIDANENRAKLSRTIISKKFDGIIFHDNAEWYRKSISIFLDEGYIEIPFFGIKPIDDHVASTSVLVKESNVSKIFSSNWKAIPKFCEFKTNHSWDNEFQ